MASMNNVFVDEFFFGLHLFSILKGGISMKTKRFCLLLIVISVTMFLAACGAPAAAPTATPIPPTAVPPTDTPIPPTATPVPPAATSVPPTPKPVQPGESTLELGEITSEALEGNLLGDPATREFVIYLPPSYATSDSRYPVVYALHGFTGNQWSMMVFQEQVDRMIQAGDIPEMIVVMPDASNTYQGSFYSNSPTIGDYETYIASELMSWVDAHYRTIPDVKARGITGCSMGGLGAVRLGLQFPQVYGVVAGVSGPYLQAYHGLLKMALSQIESVPQTFAELAEQPFPVQATFAIAAATASNPENPPFYLDIPFTTVDGKFQWVDGVYQRMGAVYADTALEDYPVSETQLQNIMLYHGDQDPLAYAEGARVLSAMLTERGIAHEYLETNGGHCDLAYAPVVQFMADHLAFEMSAEAAEPELPDIISGYADNDGVTHLLRGNR